MLLARLAAYLTPDSTFDLHGSDAARGYIGSSRTPCGRADPHLQLSELYP